jgi:hypothetical protein
MARLAEHAGVSDPTIVRLVKKLGFGGYAEFQDALLSDMDHRLRSPRTLLQPRSHLNKDDAWGHYLADSQRLLVETQVLTQPEDIRILLDWLLDTRHQIYCFGGRFSSLMANYLLNHLRCCAPAALPWKTTRNCPTACSICNARTWCCCSTIAAIRPRPCAWPVLQKAATPGWCCSPTSMPHRCGNWPT